MKAVTSIAFSLLLASCNYDSGVSKYSRTIGKNYSLSCIESNLEKFSDFQINKTDLSAITLTSKKVEATLKLDIQGSRVSGYSLKTKAYQQVDGDLHDRIINLLESGC